MTEQPASAAKPPKGDDRNLVAVDQTSAPTFEDRLFLFWKKYRNLVLGGIVVVVAAIAGLEIARMMARSQERAVREEFGVATTLEAKRAFASAHPAHPLAGLALLTLADDAYRNGRFEDALRDYAAAATAAADSAIGNRARLGEGVAAVQAGQASRGETTLRQLAEDTTVLDAIRNQAWYELAVVATESGDHARAREIIDRLVAQDRSGWGFLAQQLRDRLPQDDVSFSFPSAGTPGDSAPTPESAPAAP